MIIAILLLLILAACVGFLYSEGLWGNALRLISAIVAALVAMNFYEPAADWLRGLWTGADFFWDFVAAWGIFAVCVLALCQVADRLSRVKVRFLKIVDQIGSAVLSVLTGWVMVCFTLATLHMAPLGPTFLWGSFVPDKPMLFGLSPDDAWLNFVGYESEGPMVQGAEAGGKKPTVFESPAEFKLHYFKRRAALELQAGATGSFLIEDKH